MTFLLIAALIGLGLAASKGGGNKGAKNSVLNPKGVIAENAYVIQRGDDLNAIQKHLGYPQILVMSGNYTNAELVEMTKGDVDLYDASFLLLGADGFQNVFSTEPAHALTVIGVAFDFDGTDATSFTVEPNDEDAFFEALDDVLALLGDESSAEMGFSMAPRTRESVHGVRKSGSLIASAYRKIRE